MTDRLEAWLEGQHIGTFEFETGQPVTFTYAGDAPATPVSLSLPRDRPATKRAAGNFLENPLPDHATTRERIAVAYGATSARSYDLLVSAGVTSPAGSCSPLAAKRPGPNQGT